MPFLGLEAVANFDQFCLAAVVGDRRNMTVEYTCYFLACASLPRHVFTNLTGGHSCKRKSSSKARSIDCGSDRIPIAQRVEVKRLNQIKYSPTDSSGQQFLLKHLAMYRPPGIAGFCKMHHWGSRSFQLHRARTVRSLRSIRGIVPIGQ